MKCLMLRKTGSDKPEDYYYIFWTEKVHEIFRSGDCPDDLEIIEVDFDGMETEDAIELMRKRWKQER